MAKTIAAYKGIWKQAAAAGTPDAAPEEIQAPRGGIIEPASLQTRHLKAADKLGIASSSLPGQAAGQTPAAVVQDPPPPETAAPEKVCSGDNQGSSTENNALLSADELAHRYRLLVLKEHRHKLGRDLLAAETRDPWRLAWDSFSSFGQSFRPWAHARLFALGCYLSVEMSPDILRQLRHPLWLGRYRRSMRGLWRLLEIMAQKTGQKPRSRFVFNLFYLCPPLGVLIYETQLQRLLKKTQGSGSVAPTVLASSP